MNKAFYSAAASLIFFYGICLCRWERDLTTAAASNAVVGFCRKHRASLHYLSFHPSSLVVVVDVPSLAGNNSIAAGSGLPQRRRRDRRRQHRSSLPHAFERGRRRRSSLDMAVAAVTRR